MTLPSTGMTSRPLSSSRLSKLIETGSSLKLQELSPTVTGEPLALLTVPAQAKELPVYCLLAVSSMRLATAPWPSAPVMARR